MHAPNERKRGPKAASEFKRAGYPVLILDLAAGAWHGLRIEMKAKGGKPTAAWLEWIARLQGAGYRAEMYYGFDEARICITDYLKGA